jgi:hypothetical protein
VGVDVGGVGKATVYGYFLEFQEQADYGKSTQTLGLRFAGNAKLTDAWKQVIALKLALYGSDNDDVTRDTTKIWLFCTDSFDVTGRRKGKG